MMLEIRLGIARCMYLSKFRLPKVRFNEVKFSFSTVFCQVGLPLISMVGAELVWECFFEIKFLWLVDLKIMVMFISYSPRTLRI